MTTGPAGTILYIDGEKKAENGVFVSDTTVSGRDFALGVIVNDSGIAPYTDGGIGYFQGLIDDVRIYDRVLSETEIAQLFTGPPTADAGPDQIVFDEVRLDGSRSGDALGTLVGFEWRLTHRDNPSHSRTAYGETAVLSDLAPGFYDVILTVTDDDGATDTDDLEVAAAGKKGDLDLDGDVDGDDLAAFADRFGE